MLLITRIGALLLLLVVWESSTLGPPAGAVQAAWRMTQVAGPALTIPGQVPAQAGGAVTVPVTFTANGNQISSLIFSVDYDETWLSLSSTDGNGDGVPDAVAFNVPAAFVASATFDGSDSDGEIDIVIADMFPPLAGLPDGNIVTITLAVATPSSATEATVRFSRNPTPSFGSSQGASVAGTSGDGSVRIAVGSCPAFVNPPVGTDDLAALAARWRQPVGAGSAYDLDGDGDVDVVDITRLAREWGSSCG